MAIRTALLLGFVLLVGCASEGRGPAAEAQGPAADSPTAVADQASPFTIPGWSHAPADQPAAYEGPLSWQDHIAMQEIKGDFNGDGSEDTAVILERTPSAERLEEHYGDRADAVGDAVREFGVFAFFGGTEADLNPRLLTSRVNGVGLYGLETRPSTDDSPDSIVFVKYDSSEFTFTWSGAGFSEDAGD